MLFAIADRIMALLREMPEVKDCRLYGSLAAGTQDDLSDIDISIDVSGSDNGLFMLGLAERLGREMPVLFSDYAPSLVPEKYIVSVAVDENNPTRMVDLCCEAEPHCMTVTRQQVRELNDGFAHMLKLWTANWKHFVRGADCRRDILRMAGRIGIREPDSKDEAQILAETLEWIEKNVPPGLEKYVMACRREFDKNAAMI